MGEFSPFGLQHAHLGDELLEIRVGYNTCLRKVQYSSGYPARKAGRYMGQGG